MILLAGLVGVSVYLTTPPSAKGPEIAKNLPSPALPDWAVRPATPSAGVITKTPNNTYTANLDIPSGSQIIADFESGVDSRGSIACWNNYKWTNPGWWITPKIQSAWGDSNADNINYWDMWTDNDGQNGVCDYHLYFPNNKQDWSSYGTLSIRWYGWTYSGDGTNRKGPQIQFGYHTDKGWETLGSPSTVDNRAEVSTFDISSKYRQNIDDIYVRVEENYFAQNLNGPYVLQRTHLHSVWLGGKYAKTTGGQEGLKARPGTLGSGIVLIHKDNKATEFAKQLAQKRNWIYLEVNTSNAVKIREAIMAKATEKRQQTKDYLLILGSENTVPIREDPDHSYGISPVFQGVTLWVQSLDNLYYGNIDNDPFVELKVGRIPFDDKERIESYFNDLTVGGSGIVGYNALEANTSANYNALQNFIDLSVPYGFEGATKSKIKDIIASAKIFIVDTHGDVDIFQVCKTGGSQCMYATDDVSELSNKPVLITSGCLTAQKLGKKIIEKGARIYFGNFSIGGSESSLIGITILKEILLSDTMGGALKESQNRLIAQQIAEWKWLSEYNKKKMITTIDVSNFGSVPFLGLGTNKLPQTIGDPQIVLYGDPSISITSGLGQRKVKGLSWGVDNNKIVLDISAPSKGQDSNWSGTAVCYQEAEVPCSAILPESSPVNAGKTGLRSVVFIPSSYSVADLKEASSQDGNKNELEVSFSALIKGSNDQYLATGVFANPDTKTSVVITSSGITKSKTPTP